MINVGDTVKATRPCDGKDSIQFVKGKVIYKNKLARCLVQFFHNICGHNGNGIGKRRHCWMCDEKVLKKEG